MIFDKIIKMKRIKYLIVLILLSGIGVFLYFWFLPHRNILNKSSDKQLDITELTEAFIQNEDSANKVFLKEDGNSLILEVKGIIGKIGVDSKRVPFIFLTNLKNGSGFNAFFTKADSSEISTLKKGDLVIIKGAIVSGNHYDKDLDFNEPGVIVQSNIIK